MKPVAQFSIQQKLLVLICTAAGLALLAVLGAVVIYEARTFRPRAEIRLQRPANIIGEVIQSALDFGDQEAAQRYLQKCCEAQEEIVLAVVYDSGGSVFASYRRPNDAAVIPDRVGAAGFNFMARELTLWQPIRRKDQVLGQLYMVEKLPPLPARLPQYSIMTGTVVFALVVVGGVLLFGVRRNFLLPLASLVDTTARVRRQSDYSIRATLQREDELGRLAQAFNQMLEVIGQRDAALRQASELIQNVFNAATEVLIIATDTQGKVTLFNAGAERSLGYAAGEIVGKQTPVIWHLAEELAARAAELSKRYGGPIQGFDIFVEPVRRGPSDARAWTFVRKNGTHLTVHLVITAMRDAKGDITGFLGVGSDVTVRMAAEKALRESEHKFRTLVEQSTDGIFITNAQGGFVDINSTGAALLGCQYPGCHPVAPPRHR
ncbi:MAG: PAS domain S-box protein [Verrucomicrobiota bacterium]